MDNPNLWEKITDDAVADKLIDKTDKNYQENTLDKVRIFDKAVETALGRPLTEKEQMIVRNECEKLIASMNKQ
jgi:hypothetical protein